jgi:glycosyltransferase involved in cell wall biosynthesis
VSTSAQARRRRALIVAYCFPPHAAIGTHRTLRLVSHLAQSGWAVDVLSAEPGAYLAGTPIDDQLLARVPVSVRVVRSGAFRGFTKVGRVLTWLRGARPAAASSMPSAPIGATPAPPRESAARALKTLLEDVCALPDKDVGWLAPAVVAGMRSFSSTPPDVVFSSAPPWTTHLAALALASHFKCRWVADFRDPWVRSPWARYRTATTTSLATRLERRVVQRADATVFTTQTARDEFARHYGPPLADRFYVVFNGCDPTEFGSAPVDRDLSHFTLLHAGTLYGGRSPLPLLRAVASLVGRDEHLRTRLRVKFLGATGFGGQDLARLCSDLGLAGIVEFVPRVDRSLSLDEMRRASALLILQGGTSMAIPGKLYEYLAAGRPVLALCEEGEMAALIRSNRLGAAVSPSDEEQIEQALQTLLDAPPDAWAAAGESLFDGRLRAAELAGILCRVADATTGAATCVA